MSPSPLDHGRAAELRTRAAQVIGVPSVGVPSVGGSAFASTVDALAVLHSLAASPATAADALALLHELQVHQVELELQSQELEDARPELEAALRYQTELFECQPAACVTVDKRLVIHEMNPAAARMFDVDRTRADGFAIAPLLGVPGTELLRAAIERLAEPSRRTVSFSLTLQPVGGAQRPVWAALGRHASGTRFLLNLIESEAP